MQTFRYLKHYENNLEDGKKLIVCEILGEKRMEKVKTYNTYSKDLLNFLNSLNTYDDISNFLKPDINSKGNPAIIIEI